LFASEIRAFTSYDPQWIENPDWKIFFLAFGNIPQPFSTLKNVFSLPPGNYLEVDLNSYQSVMSTYDLASVSNWISEKEEVLGRIRNELKDSLHRRLKGDDNFALLLSGGLGSTILALIADCFKTKISTISINFAEHHFDEKDYQREVLNNTSHLYPTYLNVTSSMFWEQVNDFFKSLDQPSIDGINMYFVAECAQIEGFNSVVSGIGVDEIFGNSNTILKSLNFLRRLPYKNRLAKFLSNIKDSFGRLTYLDLKGATGDYLFLRGIFTIEQICKISGKDEYHIKSILKKVTLPRWFNSSDPLYKSYLESNFYLRNQLLKDANNMGSWHGITIRAPFLSTNIYKALQTIHPLKSYFKNGKKKLLVEAFKTILPTKIYRRKKNGFEFPIDSWLKNNETSLRRLTEDNFFTAEIIDQFLNNKIHWSKPWALAVISQHDQKKNKKCQKKKLVMVEN
jgi:asparagine synthase (glutamine-hydrolysing)